MANPYHDETGRFCSKGEMQTAINNLAKKGDLDNYFKLRKEFEEIEQNKMTVSRDTVKKLFNSGVVMPVNTSDPEEIAGIYSVMQDKLKRDDAYPGMFLDMINNPNTPEEVKNDILTNASHGLKMQLADKMASELDPSTGEDIKQLVTSDKSGRVFRNVVYTPKLTFEEKYNLAKQSQTGLGTLAEAYPNVFFQEPELSKELFNQTKKLYADGNRDAKKLGSILAKHSPDSEHHKFIIENADGLVEWDSPYGALSKNPNLSLTNSIALIGHTAESDIERSDEVVQNVSRNLYARYRNRDFVATLDGPYAPKRKPLQKVLPESTTRELQGLKAKSHKSVSDEVKIISLTAAVDAHQQNYDYLVREEKALSKRKAPPVNAQGDTLETVRKRLKNADKYIAIQNYLNDLDYSSNQSL